MIMPLVSIVMPSFNSEKFIGKAIQSVIDQTYEAWELLIVDGGSLDSTVDVINSYITKDSRIILLINENDQGPAHARYKGIKKAKGEWIAFFDSDDVWLHTKLDKQVKGMLKANLDFSYTNYRKINEFGKIISKQVPVRKKYNFSECLRYRGMATFTMMIRKELLTEDIICIWKRAGCEDMIWWTRVMKKYNISANLIGEDLARYRSAEGQLSRNFIYTLKAVWRMYINDLGLTKGKAITYYVSYFFDSLWRKTRFYYWEHFKFNK
jgi:teichuronic acid biosynthesis glycosyltransferase TuaG